MPRQPREHSPTSIYHIMSRGINKMEIFQDTHDRQKYLDILHRVKVKYGFELYSFCLMTNHTHLLIKETDAEIAKVMASINIRYSMFFNKKYSRVGSLFQERYRSEPILWEAQCLVCARYIHNNPVKAGIVDAPQDYRWSSYHDYVQKTGNPLLAKATLLELFDQDPASSLRQFVQFTETRNEDRFLDYDVPQPDVKDHLQQAEIFLRDRFNIRAEEVRSMEYHRRCTIIVKILAEIKLPQEKLGQVLGMSSDAIYRAKKKIMDSLV